MTTEDSKRVEKMKNYQLEGLVKDAQYTVASYSDAQTLGRLANVSKAMRAVADDKLVWQQKLKDEFAFDMTEIKEAKSSDSPKLIYQRVRALHTARYLVETLTKVEFADIMI